jgi:hypothetical protein
MPVAMPLFVAGCAAGIAMLGPSQLAAGSPAVRSESCTKVPERDSEWLRICGRTSCVFPTAFAESPFAPPEAAMGDMPGAVSRTPEELGVAASIDPAFAIGEGAFAPRDADGVAVISTIMLADAPSRSATGHVSSAQHIEGERRRQRSGVLSVRRHAGQRIFVSLREAREVR